MIQFGVRWSTVTRAADFATSGVGVTAARALEILAAAADQETAPDKTARKVLVLDIREASAAGQVPGGQRMPLSQLSLDLAELPALTTFLVMDDDDDRARLAARFLRFRGLDESFYITGGVSAWRAAGGAWSAQGGQR